MGAPSQTTQVAVAQDDHDQTHLHAPNPIPIASMKKLAKDLTAFNMVDGDSTEGSGQQQYLSSAVDDTRDREDGSEEEVAQDAAQPPPPSLISPAFTPPTTPSLTLSRSESGVNLASSEGRLVYKEPKSTAVDTTTSLLAAPRLLDTLPVVTCIVRARIPTTLEASGQEMFLHCYQNSIDNKEHMAIVFGDRIRSKSLFAPRKGETELDRMTRGAYDGRLHPGRTVSRLIGQASSSSKLSSVGAGGTLNTKSTKSALDRPVSGQDGLTTIEKSSVEDDTTPPLVRIHSECYTGETVWSARCDCGEQLDEAARLMSDPSSQGGVIIYLRQEGRGIGLSEKLKAYNLQDLGSDTVEANLLLRHPADARSYGLATAMLMDLGLGGDQGIRLLTNNPDKVRAVEGPNREVRVRERVEMVPVSWRTGGTNGILSDEVGAYLRTKIEKMGHMLSMNGG